MSSGELDGEGCGGAAPNTSRYVGGTSATLTVCFALVLFPEQPINEPRNAKSSERSLRFRRDDAPQDGHFQRWFPARFRPSSQASNHIAHNVRIEHHIGDMTGWAGDLVQTFGDWIIAKRADSSITDSYGFARTWIARKGGYSANDFDEDVDAGIIAGISLSDRNVSIAEIIKASYMSSEGYEARYTRFFMTRFANSYDTAFSAALDVLTSVDIGVVAYREGILGLYLGVLPRPGEYTPTDLMNIARAWTDVLKAKINGTE